MDTNPTAPTPQPETNPATAGIPTPIAPTTPLASAATPVADTTQTPPPTANPHHSSTWLYILFGVILLLVVGVTGYFLLMKNNASPSAQIQPTHTVANRQNMTPSITPGITVVVTPITSQNEDQQLNNTSTNIDQSLNQVNQDINSMNQTDTSQDNPNAVQ